MESFLNIKLVIKTLLPSFKLNEDILFKYNSFKGIKPIKLNEISLIAPVKTKILALRQKASTLTITREQKKLSVIIPYRHRKEHLDRLLPTLSHYLDTQKIDYEILVVEQNDNNIFNKAKLMNIGALNSRDKSEYFVFHDVDLIPINIDYTYCNHTLKLFNFIKIDGRYKEYGPTTFGGAILVPKNIFFDINGFSNNYRQWGKEDDDFLLRHLFKGYVPFYDTEGKFEAMPHTKSILVDVNGKKLTDKKAIKKNRRLYKTNRKTFSKFKRGITSQDHDGISNIKGYEIGSIKEDGNIKTIKVKFTY